MSAAAKLNDAQSAADVPSASWKQRVYDRWNTNEPYQYHWSWLRKLSDEQLHKIRWIGFGIWALSVALVGLFMGWSVILGSWFTLAFVGFGIACIGHSRLLRLYVDWAPFVLFIIVYGWIKHLARWIEIPVHWHLALNIDRWLFGGTVPNVWVQEHWRYATPPWWEFILMAVYSSYFFMPYLAAFFIWVRSRVEFRRYILGFLGVTLVGFSIYTLLPAAPPWAAARCTAADVVEKPAHTPCMFSAEHAGQGSLLGAVENQHDSPEPWVLRLTARAWGEIAPGNLASGLEEFQYGARRELREADKPTQTPVAPVDSGEGILVSAYESTNLVAAVPSLHAALTMFIASHLLFARRWKTGLLALAYALTMAFALVFFAEHYVFDIILGWILAISIPGLLARRARRKAVRL
ncbi:MAG: phosphatase PAP2 family protein [Corynebacterium sp.]|nr:phosphatase PAP2 family protein [Corynebacterium sp.]